MAEQGEQEEQGRGPGRSGDTGQPDLAGPDRTVRRRRRRGTHKDTHDNARYIQVRSA